MKTAEKKALRIARRRQWVRNKNKAKRAAELLSRQALALENPTPRLTRERRVRLRNMVQFVEHFEENRKTLERTLSPAEFEAYTKQAEAYSKSPGVMEHVYRRRNAQ